MNINPKSLELPSHTCEEISGYAHQEVSLNDFQTPYRINELTEFMVAYISNYPARSTSETHKKLYCLNLTKHQERKDESQQKNFTYHLTSQNSPN